MNGAVAVAIPAYVPTVLRVNAEAASTHNGRASLTVFSSSLGDSGSMRRQWRYPVLYTDFHGRQDQGSAKKPTFYFLLRLMLYMHTSTIII